jgi:hypothetical protein
MSKFASFTSARTNAEGSRASMKIWLTGIAFVANSQRTMQGRLS